MVYCQIAVFLWLLLPSSSFPTNTLSHRGSVVPPHHAREKSSMRYETLLWGYKQRAPGRRKGNRDSEYDEPSSQPLSMKKSRWRKDSGSKRQHNNRRNNDSTRISGWHRSLQQKARDEKSPVCAERLLLDRLEGPSSQVVDTAAFNTVLKAYSRERSYESAQRAHSLLERLIEYPLADPDSYSYAAVLNAYAQCRRGGVAAAQKAEALLDHYVAHSRPLCNTDLCHNAVMNAWSVSGNPKAGIHARRILQQLQDHPTLKPTRVSYNACLKAFARSQNPHQAQELLDQMKSNESSIVPDKISYTTVMLAWAKSGNAPRAEALLEEMEESLDLQPDARAYTTVLTAYAHTNHPEKALNLLQRMEMYSSERPNAVTYNALIHVFAQQTRGQTQAASQAEALLRHLEKLYATTGANEVKPDVITYTAVISSYANCGTVAAAERAEDLLEEMLSNYESSQDDDYLPNTKTFASVLHAWAKSGDSVALSRAETLLARMDTLYRSTGRDDLMPTTIVFYPLFYILSTSSDQRAAARAEQLLARMQELHQTGYPNIQPDATTYAYLINAYTKSKIPDAASRAAKVLKDVESRYQDGETDLQPSPLFYSAVLQAYAKSASKEGAESAEALLRRNLKSPHKYGRPSTLCYNAVMDAHARSGEPTAAKKAQRLLEEMDRATNVAPNTRSFNAAILAWKNSVSSDATTQAEALLKRMNDKYKTGDVSCKPDSVTINSIIGVWAKSGKAHAGERAEEFLNFMETHGDATLKPDRYSYNSVMDAYARCGKGRKAEAVYRRMCDRFKATGDPSLKPDRVSLTSLKSAWTKSSDEDAHIQLQRIGEMMQGNVHVA